MNQESSSLTRSTALTLSPNYLCRGETLQREGGRRRRGRKEEEREEEGGEGGRRRRGRKKEERKPSTFGNSPLLKYPISKTLQLQGF